MSGTVGAKDGTVVASAAVGEDKIIENNCSRVDNSVGVRVPKPCSSFVYLMASTGEPDNVSIWLHDALTNEVLWTTDIRNLIFGHFSPASKYYVASMNDDKGKVFGQVWHTETGEMLRTLRYDILENGVTTACNIYTFGSSTISNSGTRLVVSLVGPRVKVVLDLDTGDHLFHINLDSESSLRFSGDDRLLLCRRAHDGVIDILDAQTGDRLTQFVGQRLVSDTRCSLDGRLVLQMGVSGSRIYDIMSGRLLMQANDLIRACCFGPDGTWIALLESKHLKAWNIGDGSIIFDLACEQNMIQADNSLGCLHFCPATAKVCFAEFSEDDNSLVIHERDAVNGVETSRSQKYDYPNCMLYPCREGNILM
jgi:WD40 repeat protein